MTHEEKQSLSLKIATLGEAAGIDQELLWEAAQTCPQGHANYNECGCTYDNAVGGLCMDCWLAWAQNGDYGAAHDALREYAHDQNWHPKWRIGKQARDMTNPAVLLPVVEAWIFQCMTKRDVLIEWQGGMGQWSAEFSMLIPGDGWTVVGMFYDPDRTIAEAKAFVEALEAEKGEHADV